MKKPSWLKILLVGIFVGSLCLTYALVGGRHHASPSVEVGVAHNITSSKPSKMRAGRDTAPASHGSDGDGAMLGGVRQSVLTQLEEQARDEVRRIPSEFASQARYHPMIYTDARRMYKGTDAATMYAFLDNNGNEREWRYIAQLIGFVSDRGDIKSIDVLKQYLERIDVWPKVKDSRLDSFDVGCGKALCLEWIGVIGGEHAESILAKAVTPAGAEDLAKGWIDFAAISYPGGRENILAQIRGRAAMGLVFCRSATANELVERLYREEKEKCVSNGKTTSALFRGLPSAMGHKAYIEEHGLQKRLELYGSGEYFNEILPYVEKYMLK